MDSISSLIESQYFLRIFLPVLVPTMLLAFFWWRAKTVHVWWDRLWRVIAGSTDANDPVLKALLRESRDVERCRFTYRLNVERVQDIHRLASWSSLHGISLDRLRKVRLWVDPESEEILGQPPKRYTLKVFLAACSCMIVFLLVAYIFGGPNAFLRMRESEISFKTNGTSIAAPMNGWTLRLERCATDPASLVTLTGFDPTEAQELCRTFNDGTLKQFVDVTIRQQKWFGGTLMLVAFCFATRLLLAALSAQEAIKIRKKLEQQATRVAQAHADADETDAQRTKPA